ncbi:hypothetical protein C8R44DRAFT_742908 [Mycena epipterygia]|nr:hypothetical protein C8R44DRAFT_742908 [Mycena epipterygia]
MDASLCFFLPIFLLPAPSSAFSQHPSVPSLQTFKTFQRLCHLPSYAEPVVVIVDRATERQYASTIKFNLNFRKISMHTPTSKPSFFAASPKFPLRCQLRSHYGQSVKTARQVLSSSSLWRSNYMGLSWCNLVLTTVSNNQIYGGSSTILAALLLSFIYYLPAAIEINQLGASENTLSGTLRVLMASISCHTKISSRGRREYLWYWSGPTQNGVSIPPRGWRGRLAPPTPNTSSGTPRVLITSISPHTKRCYHPPSRLNGSLGTSDPEHVVGDAESADHINQPPHKTLCVAGGSGTVYDYWHG